MSYHLTLAHEILSIEGDKDMSENTAEAIAHKIIKNGTNLPGLPGIGPQLLSLAQQPIESIDVASLCKLIEGDPVFTARILQLANSSYFRTTTKIVGLRQAVMHIGLMEAINSVWWFFFQDAMPKFPKLQGLSGDDYWAHSWACATANRMLGRPDYLIQVLPGELYIIGLLHGIGKLILALNNTEDFQRCLDTCMDSGHPLELAELEVLGTTDTEIAYLILKKWNLPDNICSAIRYYRNPALAKGESHEAAALTQFAYFLTNASGIGKNGDCYQYDLSKTFISEKWSTPLADKVYQDKVVKDIYATLNKKSQSLNSNEEEEQVMDSPEAIEPGVDTPVQQSAGAAENRGIIAWFLSLFK